MPDNTDRTAADARILGVIRQAINLNTMGEPERAVELLLPMLSEFPEEPAVHLHLAWFLRGSNRFEEAIEHARRAVQLLPRSSKASLVLFHTLWKPNHDSEEPPRPACVRLADTKTAGPKHRTRR